jgi:hypothetical protein
VITLLSQPVAKSILGQSYQSRGIHSTLHWNLSRRRIVYSTAQQALSNYISQLAHRDPEADHNSKKHRTTGSLGNQHCFSPHLGGEINRGSGQPDTGGNSCTALSGKLGGVSRHKRGKVLPCTLVWYGRWVQYCRKDDITAHVVTYMCYNRSIDLLLKVQFIHKHH